MVAPRSSVAGSGAELELAGGDFPTKLDAEALGEAGEPGWQRTACGRRSPAVRSPVGPCPPRAPAGLGQPLIDRVAPHPLTNGATPEQLCELLQVRKSWVYDQAEAGRLPHVRLGNQLRFRRSDLAEYLRRIAG